MLRLTKVHLKHRHFVDGKPRGALCKKPWGIDVSPNMDKLINEGWAFTRMYATGTRSVRGIEAVTTGFSPTPARSVVKLGKSQNNFFSIAGLLKTQQYTRNLFMVARAILTI